MRIIKRIGFAMLMVVALSAVQPVFADDPPLPVPVGRVVWVKGTFIATMDNQEKRILQKSSLIYLHDTLITENNSEAQIVFDDQSLMTFYPDTKFHIDQYEHKTAKMSAGKYIMSLIEGGFRTITGLIAKNNPKEYQVNTPVATIGVRGTDYVVQFRQNKLYIGHYAGVPCVTGKDQGKSQLCLTEKTRYASVDGAGVGPVALKDEPIVFREKLEIVPYTIAPFGSPSPTGKPLNKSSGGAITSFCISQ